MRRSHYAVPLLTLLAGAACVAVAWAAEPAAKGRKPGSAAGRPIAVVELFTSEGCSSCPPADAALARLAKDREAKGDVIFLAFHVDYWDNLGWPDPFASAQATARQKDYVRTMSLRSMYTPQMIVNGVEEFTGSDEKRAEAAIERAVFSGDARAMTVRAEAQAEGRSVRVEWSASKPAAAGTELLLALVEDGLATDVKRGENAGRKLSHERVVRVFIAGPCRAGEQSGDAALLAPKDVDLARSRVVVVQQDATAGRIVGAGSVGVRVGPGGAK